MKNFSLKDYFLNLSNSLVGDELLKIIHCICQLLSVCFLLLILIRNIRYFSVLESFFVIILIPVCSILMRLGFEIIESLFAIKRSTATVADAFGGMLDCEECDCEDCDCECCECDCCECENCEGKCVCKNGGECTCGDECKCVACKKEDKKVCKNK